MVIPVNLGEKSYDIYLEKNGINKAGEFFDLDRRVLVVTDDGVPADYAKGICDACKDAVLITIKQGEESKCLDTFSMLSQNMLENGFTRKDCVVAVGGGVVGDLAGFTAACYMRGIDFYNVPTTLLSQVDSSVGGKTGVDFCGIKNIIGAFHQPKAVLIDTEVLKTLDKRQFACGCAEIIKMAATFDAKLFDEIENGAINHDLDGVIGKALRIKADVVEKDEKESGLRKVLNFGHTIGHGIESATDLYHGECVALGMLPMTCHDVRERVESVLKAYQLPTYCNADVKAVVDAAMHDKKSEGNEVSIVKVESIGAYKIEKADKEQLEKLYKEVF